MSQLQDAPTSLTIHPWIGLVQGQVQAAQLQKEVQHLRSEVDRLRNELSQERNDKGQHASRVTALEQQLQQKTASLVHVLHLLCSCRCL